MLGTLLNHSGAMTPEQIFETLEEQRYKIRNIESQLSMLVCQAFPSYTPEKLDDLDWETFMERVAQAELMMLGFNLELPLRREVPEEEPPQTLDIEKMIRESERALGVHSEEDHQRLEQNARDLREEYLRSRFGSR